MRFWLKKCCVIGPPPHPSIQLSASYLLKFVQQKTDAFSAANQRAAIFPYQSFVCWLQKHVDTRERCRTLGSYLVLRSRERGGALRYRVPSVVDESRRWGDLNPFEPIETRHNAVSQCKPRSNGPCENCLRRYPPVQCYVDENAHRREETRTQGSISVALEQSVGLLTSGPTTPVWPERRRDNQREHQLTTDAASTHCSQFITPYSNTPYIASLYTEEEHDNYIDRPAPQKPSSPSQLNGGIIAPVNSSLTHLPIDTNLRNAELFHYCTLDRALISRRTNILQSTKE